jgi:hypothetical protein
MASSCNESNGNKLDQHDTTESRLGQASAHQCPAALISGCAHFLDDLTGFGIRRNSGPSPEALVEALQEMPAIPERIIGIRQRLLLWC